jgi:hypothetical protein
LPCPEILHNATSSPSSEVPDISPIITRVFLDAMRASVLMFEFISVTKLIRDNVERQIWRKLQ